MRKVVPALGASRGTLVNMEYADAARLIASGGAYWPEDALRVRGLDISPDVRAEIVALEGVTEVPEAPPVAEPTPRKKRAPRKK